MHAGRPNGRRIPNASHEAGHWRIGGIVPDFTLEDVWEMPVSGRAEEFPELVELLLAGELTSADSPAARLLWRLRDRLGAWFGLDGDAAPGEGGPTIPGSDETSLAGRLPAELRGSAAGLRFTSLPFIPLYRSADEFAAEIGNRTMHGVLHLAWAPRDGGARQAELAIYVKPNGRLGKVYMTAIKPFRHLIVYPAMMRQSGRAWARRPGSGPGPGPS